MPMNAVSLHTGFTHSGSLLFDVTQQFPSRFKTLRGIGDSRYVSAFSRLITFPDLAEYVNNAPVTLRLIFNVSSFLMKEYLLFSLKLTN